MLDKKLSAGLQLIANGVFVIATKDNGQVRAFTATWVSQAAYDNPLVMVSVSRSHDTYASIVSAQKLWVNIIGVSHKDLAIFFGGRKGPPETFAHYFREEQGEIIPILKDALAALECNLIATYDARDHSIFLGEVVDAHVYQDEDPLLYWRRRRFVKPASADQARP